MRGSGQLRLCRVRWFGADGRRPRVTSCTEREAARPSVDLPGPPLDVGSATALEDASRAEDAAVRISVARVALQGGTVPGDVPPRGSRPQSGAARRMLAEPGCLGPIRVAERLSHDFADAAGYTAGMLQGHLVERLRRLAREGSLEIQDLRLVVLFGSVAHGQPRPDSDVDLAVLGGDLWQQLDLGSRLGAALGREPHVVDLASASDTLAYEVARHGIVLFEQSSGQTWPRFQATSATRYFDFQPVRSRCARALAERWRGEVPSV